MEIRKWRDGTAIEGHELVAELSGWDELGRPRILIGLESGPLRPEVVQDRGKTWKIQWVAESGERGRLPGLNPVGPKEAMEEQAAEWGATPTFRRQGIRFDYADGITRISDASSPWPAGSPLSEVDFCPLRRQITPEEGELAREFLARAEAHFGRREPAKIVAAQEGEIYIPTISPPDPEEGRGPGRPRIRAESRNVRVQVRITPSLNEKLEAGAQAAGITPAEHAFLLLERALLRPKPPSTPRRS